MANCYKPTSALSAIRPPADPERNVFNPKAVSARVRFTVLTGNVPQMIPTAPAGAAKANVRNLPQTPCVPPGSGPIILNISAPQRRDEPDREEITRAL